MTRNRHGINAYKQVAESSASGQGAGKVDKAALFEQYKKVASTELAHRMMDKVPSNPSIRSLKTWFPMEQWGYWRQ